MLKGEEQEEEEGKKRAGKLDTIKEVGVARYTYRVSSIRYAITVMKKYRKSALAVIHRFSFFKLIYLIIR